MAMDGVYLVLGALTFVFVSAPSLFTTAVLQSVLTWRERVCDFTHNRYIKLRIVFVIAQTCKDMNTGRTMSDGHDR